MPAVVPEPAPLIEPAPPLQPEVQSGDDPLGWATAAEQRTPSVEVSEPSVASRPVVKVTSVEPPPRAEHEPTVQPLVTRARPRATVRVNPIPEDVAASDGSARTSEAAAPQMGRPSDADIPELVLETPVEMWFGESRVGVKPGSATYERFRNFADVLFDDLNESRTRADNP